VVLKGAHARPMGPANASQMLWESFAKNALLAFGENVKRNARSVCVTKEEQEPV